jgi:hypothetical protein
MSFLKCFSIILTKVFLYFFFTAGGGGAGAGPFGQAPQNGFD